MLGSESQEDRVAEKGGLRSGPESQMEEPEPAGTSQGVSVGMVCILWILQMEFSMC